MKEFFNILAIDPGNNTGIAILTISIPDFKIVNIHTTTIILDNYVPDYITDRLLYRLDILSKLITELNINYQPVALGLEIAFLNMSRPKAVIQLYQYLSVIENVSRNLNPFIKVFKNPPKYIKKYIGATGEADKLDMMSAISKVQDITSIYNIAGCTEHEIDALAIGYLAFQSIKENPLVLCAL